MGKPDKEKIRLLRLKGYTFKEIAEELGITENMAGYHCREMNLGGMIKQAKPEARPIKEVKAMVKSKNNNIEYVGGYKNNTSDVKLLCTVCGETFVMNWNSYMHSKKAECPFCRKQRSLKHNEELKKHREEKREEKRKERELNVARKNVICKLVKLREKDIKENKPHVCRNCGSEYTIRNSGFNSEKYCSKKCSDRYSNRTKRDNREEKIKAVTIDDDITVEKLYARDNGVCWLCGRKCDLSDYVVVNKTIVCGNDYPSIDHVIPLSKGGTHAWRNIKLAHRICNSIKGSREARPPV